jgi:hypothetical protein
VSLAEAAGLTEGRIAAFPQPSDHADSDFLFVHGEAASADVARCSVCHVRESCTRCHLNGASVAPIGALASDDRVAALLEGRGGEWPTPPSHAASDWALTHGVEASGAVESCANCHARPSCETCHGVGNPLVARGLGRVTAEAGVRLGAHDLHASLRTGLAVADRTLELGVPGVREREVGRATHRLLPLDHRSGPSIVAGGTEAGLHRVHGGVVAGLDPGVAPDTGREETLVLLVGERLRAGNGEQGPGAEPEERNQNQCFPSHRPPPARYERASVRVPNA